MNKKIAFRREKYGKTQNSKDKNGGTRYEK